MERDTRMGGHGTGLPETRHSVIVHAASDDAVVRQRAWDVIALVYWKPVYKYIRVRWKEQNEDAKDLTQAFFERAIEKDFLREFDPRKAKFRTFLRTCIDRFVMNEARARRAQKRGGAARVIAVDFRAAEDELGRSAPPSGESLDDYFQREWVRSVFGAAVDELRERLHAAGRDSSFEVFQRHDVDGGAPTYAELAAALDLKITSVTNRLASARREFRKILLEKLRELTATDEEYQDEVRAILGGEPP